MIFYKYLNKILLRYSFLFLLGVLALVVVNYVQLEIPEIFGTIIDGINDKTILNNNDELLYYVRNILIITVIMFIGRFSWRIFVIGSAINVESDLREMMFKHSEKLSRTYYKQKQTGALMALFTNDLQVIKDFYSDGTVMIVDFIVLGGFTIYKMFSLNVKLTLILLVPATILAVLIFFVASKLETKHKETQEAFEKLSEFTQENLSGLNVVKAYVNEDLEINKFNNFNANCAKKNISVIKYIIGINIALNFILQIIAVLIIIFGSRINLLDTAEFTVGKILEYFAYFNILVWPIMAIGQYINLKTQAKSSYFRIKEFLDEVPEIVDNSIDSKVFGKIEFRNLTFSYADSEIPVLSDVSFTINKGEFVGILGRTGSGKTTIVDLLLRQYNVDKKQIFIDDIDIMNMSIKTLRDNIGYVPQDNFLFSDTISNNISFACTEFNEEEVISSAMMSDVHNNIMEFKDKYNTILGERGVTLSGGQKQRVSIARALIKDPNIMIFDDSLSAVDTKTENTILNNLRQIRKGKTTIMIASRISTVMHLDKIILIDEGKVVDIGNHYELLSRSEFYKKMVKLQNLEEEANHYE